MKNIQIITLGAVIHPFRKLLREHLKQTCDLDIDQPHLDSDRHESSRQAHVRAAFYRILTSEIGAKCYVDIAQRAKAVLALESYTPQLLPTPRVHVPGGRSASFHTDGWYGHSPTTKTVWVPFTEIDDKCALHFCDDPAHTRDVEAAAKTRIADIYEIDRMASERSVPVVCDLEQAIVFGSDILHGSLENKSKKIRISFDFRLADVSAGFGNKPKGNFLTNSEIPGNIAPKKSAMKYITTAFARPLAITGAAQHAVCDDYAERMHLRLEATEAEIEPLSYGPTLLGYAKQSKGLTEIVMFSTASLPRDMLAIAKILKACDSNGVTLHFAAEQIRYPFEITADELLLRIRSYS
jgi:hypothetical protein